MFASMHGLSFSILDSYFGESLAVNISSGSRLDAHLVVNHQLNVNVTFTDYQNGPGAEIEFNLASVIGGQLADRIEAFRFTSPDEFRTTLDGQGGDDTLIASADFGYLWGGDGNDQITTGEGHDTIYGDDNLGTFFGNDTISAGDGNNLAYGGGGNDEIFSSAGEDFLYGNAGQDNIEAGAGRDQVFGGNGGDAIFLGSEDQTLPRAALATIR